MAASCARAVRKSFAVRHPEVLRHFAAVLKENTLRNLADPEALLKRGLGIAPADKRFCQLLGYLVTLQYMLDAEMQEGVARFFELAYEEGLVPAAPKPLEFFQ